MLMGCVDGPGSRNGIAPGNCKAVNATLENIIALAYDIPFFVADQHIADVPSWISREKYDIEAKTEDASVSQTQLRLMLQNLLADRFKLTLHEQTKDVSGYALVLSKGGPKLNRQIRSGTSLACGSFTMEALARCLSNRLGKPVVDETGISGRHDFSLTMESLAENEPNVASIFTVLEQELGLKLVSQKVPSRILVIDHVERPSEN